MSDYISPGGAAILGTAAVCAVIGVTCIVIEFVRYMRMRRHR